MLKMITFNSNTTKKKKPTAPSNPVADNFLKKYPVKKPVTYEDQYLKVNPTTVKYGGVVKLPSTSKSSSSSSSSKIVPKSTVKKTETPAVTNTESISDILRANYPTLSGGGGSSYSGNPAGMVDISGMLKAFEQAADANKSVIQQSYDQRRNDLLTSLKRYQEQNAKDVAAQQKTYLANQALVESAIAEADRQNRISAAARGLGGSGLQQLSQLQTLMSQGQTISDMASENQNTVNNLREVLANYDEDTQTALKDLETTKENSLKGINSELASNKANLEYQAREAAANRAQMEASTNAQIAAQNAQYAAEAAADEKALKSQLDVFTRNYQSELDNIKGMSDKEIKKYFKGTDTPYKNYNEAKKGIYETYRLGLGDLLNSYSVGGTSFADTQYNNLYDLYKAAASSYVKPVSTSTKAANQSLLGRNIAVKNSLTGNLFNKTTGNKSISSFLRT